MGELYIKRAGGGANVYVGEVTPTSTESITFNVGFKPTRFVIVAKSASDRELSSTTLLICEWENNAGVFSYADTLTYGTAVLSNKLEASVDLSVTENQVTLTGKNSSVSYPFVLKNLTYTIYAMKE